MVHIRDDGVYDVPMDRLWKYINDAPSHQHRSIALGQPVSTKGNAMTFKAKALNSDGKTWRTDTLVMTMNPPQGHTLEMLDGPMKGSKYTHTYTSQGAKTKVVVEGDFTIAGADEATTRKAILANFAEVFSEDSAALRNYK
jgi:hypothetical protein